MISKKKKTINFFFKSPALSIKLKKYFEVYDQILSKYINKNITFVEVGVLNGGSLHMWRNFFGSKARIIGIDFNPKALKLKKFGFEIFIGDQTSKKFWNSFYKKVGKVDILLDDGGHTNEQQVITTVSSIKNINDNGCLIVEDVYCSYSSNFGNPSKFSFINFAKKCIDDVNFKYPNIGKFKFSLNDFVSSIEFFESMVVFNVNKKKCVTNYTIINKTLKKNWEDDFRYAADFSHSTLKFIHNSIFFKFFIPVLRYAYHRIKSIKLIKFFR